MAEVTTLNSQTGQGGVTQNKNLKRKWEALDYFLLLWKLITLLYACCALGFIMPLPFGLLTLLLFSLLQLPVPISLMYYPITLAQQGTYWNPATGAGWMILMIINFAGVLLSFIALTQIKKAWRWAYTFLILGVIQCLLALSNAWLGICHFDSGDGGSFLDHCTYTINSTVIMNFITSTIIFLIAIGIVYFAEKAQRSNASDTTISATE